MKKLFYGALLIIALALVALSIRSVIASAPILSYVYSDSMEPVIMVNDGFFVWPTKDPQIGDIILYRPQKLEAELITHRIIALGKWGFITKGDHSPITDQAAGEPEVLNEQIVGKALTIGGKPLLLKGYGRMISGIQGMMGSYLRVLAAAMVTAGISLGAISLWFPRRKRKSRYHLRLRDVYRIVTAATICLVVMGMLLGSRLNQIDYLISDNPGTAGNHVHIGEIGTLDVVIQNKGLLPVWSICSGISPLSVQQTTKWIAPLSTRSLQVTVPAQNETGWLRGYVRVYIYPIVLPRFAVSFLHSQSPFLAFTGVAVALALWLKLIVWIFEKFFGLEGWIPVKAFKDKTSSRRIHRTINALFGRIRSRGRS